MNDRERCACGGGAKVVFTKRKDDEETSSTIYNTMDHRDPVLDFKKYLNDSEDIVDQVTSSMHQQQRR